MKEATGEEPMKRLPRAETPACASCAAPLARRGETPCWSSEPARRPGQCPGVVHASTAVSALDGYREGGDDGRLAQAAARVEGLGYDRGDPRHVRARWTRVEDTVALARTMGWRRVGIASCVGLLEETRQLARILEAQGLEPFPVCCKVGSFDKTCIGLNEQEKVRPGTFEPLCNPVAQARILNGLDVEVNVIMGLCVGHDMLFTRHAKAPTTTLVAKDRVTGHNSVAPLHGASFYFRRLLRGPVTDARAAPPPAQTPARKGRAP